MSTTAQYPQQLEPVFSSRQDETPERGQVLRVTVFFPDSTHDFEEERLGNYGDWLAPEIVSESEERLERILRRRVTARIAEAQAETDGMAIYR